MSGSRRAGRRIERIVERLCAAYGRPVWSRGGPPVDGLVRTILSQNTSDRNSAAAYASLRQALPTWEAVADAPVARIERAIRCGGLSRVKARRIRQILRSVREQRGSVSLGFLRRWPTERAVAWLAALPGVGPKTVACVMMFDLHRPVLPVDTHVHRVSRRLELIGERTSAARAHEDLAAACPPRLVYAFHVLLIRHGRQTCTARRPRCGQCALRTLCRWPDRNPPSR